MRTNEMAPALRRQQCGKCRNGNGRRVTGDEAVGLADTVELGEHDGLDVLCLEYGLGHQVDHREIGDLGGRPYSAERGRDVVLRVKASFHTLVEQRGQSGDGVVKASL